MELDLDTIDETRTRWLDCGGVRFLIKHAAPKESEKFRRGLISRGIARMEKGQVEINLGREMDWLRALSEAYIIDWAGEIRSADPEKAKYSPERMALVLANRGDLLRLITEAISETEAFFTGNGGPATTS